MEKKTYMCPMTTLAGEAVKGSEEVRRLEMARVIAMGWI